jgi:hypothetical protein
VETGNFMSDIAFTYPSQGRNRVIEAFFFSATTSIFFFQMMVGCLGRHFLDGVRNRVEIEILFIQSNRGLIEF